MVIVVAAAFAAGAARAEDSCTNWLPQTDGSYWRTCVDEHGAQYCQQKVGNNITRVACK